MRVGLKAFYMKNRKKYRAVVGGFSSRMTRGELTRYVRLEAVRMKGKTVTDHTWLRAGYWSRHLKVGDEVRIEARVSCYRRTNGTIDYGLDDPWLIHRYGDAAHMRRAADML